MLGTSRVEEWRGGLGEAYLFPALSFAGASLASPCSGSTPRSSNRTGGSPASGSPTRLPCFRPQRFATDRLGQFQQAVLLVQPQIGRVLRTPPLAVFPVQPLAEPTAGVLLHNLPSSRDVAHAEVVPPAGQGPVEPTHLLLGRPPRRPGARQLTDLVTDRLNFGLGGSRRQI